MSLSGSHCMVTGGAGFIGSTLIRELLHEHAKVIVLDNFSIGTRCNLDEIENDITILNKDILDADFTDVLQQYEIDYLFHLAAEPYIPKCYDFPEDFFQINANGSLHVMLSAKRAGVKRMILYSTSEVYGTGINFPMDENHPTLPLSTYAVSKLAADRLAFVLHHEQGIPVIILRQFNVFGPRESQPYIIPELITQFSNSPHVQLGNVHARRDLTFVTDAARAAVNLMQYEEAVGKAFNCGTGKDWSVEEMAHIIGDLMGHTSIDIEIKKQRLRPLDVERLQANYFKLHQLTGWEPTMAFSEGLKLTIDDFMNRGRKWLWESELVPKDKLWKQGSPDA